MTNAFTAKRAGSTEMSQGFNHITEGIVAAAIKVHRAFGPGLLESAYEKCLCYELIKNGYFVERQKAIALNYGDVSLDCCYRMDLLVENTVVVEIKAVEKLEPIHTSQMLTYLRIGNYRIGLILNFNVLLMKMGIKRVILDSA